MTGRSHALACRSLAAAALLGVCACGSDRPPPPPAPPAVVAGATTSAPALPSPTATPELVGGIPVGDLCAFLVTEVAKLQSQSTVGAVARLDDDLSDFYLAQFLPRPPGAVIDRATEKACPATRFAVLVAVNQPHLRSL